jgi:hypothetical protein
MGSWERDASLRATSPPPLSRRTTTIVALLSAACSIAVIAVVIPRGAHNKSGDATPSATTQTNRMLVDTRQQISRALVHVGENGSPGLSLTISGNSIVVSSVEALSLSTDSIVAVSSEHGDTDSAIVVTNDSKSGLVILRTLGPVSTLPHITIGDVASNVDGEQFMVFNPKSLAMDVVRRGIALATENRLVPLDMGDEISGVTAVSDSSGSIVGVAIEHNHARWLIPLDVIRELIGRVLGE